MRKVLMGLAILMMMAVGVSATTVYVGDTVTFETEPHPDDMVCDHDMSNDLGVWFYGGYALVNPDKNIVNSVGPTSVCDEYIPSYTYTVDKAGTWKFCAKVWELDVSYMTETCSGTYKEAESCMTINVVKCDNTNYEVELLGFFDAWIDTIKE